MIHSKRRHIVISDSTLCDGGRAAGIRLGPNDKVAIALALEAAGVDEIEVGMPGLCPAEVEALRAVELALTRSEPIAWCRMSDDDLDAAHRSGFRRVHVSVPLSERHVRAGVPDGRHGVLSRIRSLVARARSRGLEVVVGGEDASLASLDFVCEAVVAAGRAGAQRFRFVDALGTLDPFTVYAAFQRLCAETELELEFHGRNDLGLATANTLAAVRGGASHVTVSVLGVGARAGNAPLEEVTTALSEVECVGTNVIPSRLAGLADLVSAATGRAIPENKAIVGKHVFSHEAGVPVSGLVPEQPTAAPWAPERFGRTRRFFAGKTFALARPLQGTR
jgi:homocitrate synthase NifV